MARERMAETGWQRPVAVVGAGVMGRGIAYVAAVSGADVRLVDVSQSQLDLARDQLAAALDEGVTRGRLSGDDAAAARERVTFTTDLAVGCDGVELMIEAAVEALTTKQELFRRLDEVAPADAVAATNTSALSVGAITGVLRDPSRGVGMHFFNPVPKMRLCELIRGAATSDATMDAAEAAARRMGKETVRVTDTPGFATSRLNALIGNEGLRMLEEGVASPDDIDAAARLGLNHPMGPLEMADLVGLDVRLAVLEHLHATLGDRFRPTDLHRRLVAEGRLGRKSGRGVYRYESGRRVDGSWEPPAVT